MLENQPPEVEVSAVLSGGHERVLPLKRAWGALGGVGRADLTPRRDSPLSIQRQPPTPPQAHVWGVPEAPSWLLPARD